MRRAYRYRLAILFAFAWSIAACSRTPAPAAPAVTATQVAAPTVAAPTAAAPTATDVPAPSATPAAPTPEPTAPPATVAPQAPLPEPGAVDALLATLHNGAPFRGTVLVARNGEILLAQGYGLADAAQGIANATETRFRLGSLTKPITAVAVLLLQEAGLLDVQAPVCTYLPDCPAAWQPITLHHLLSHTSGIPELTRFPDFEPTKARPSTPAETLARFAGRPLDFAPGTAWDYSNSNYIVLGNVIEAVTGQPYADVIQERIFAPLGMDDSGYDTGHEGLAVGYRPDGSEADFIHMSIPFAAGGLYSTVEDLYKLDRALAEGSLLPPHARDLMFTPVAPIPGEMPGMGYGYGWVIEEGPAGKVIGHNGNIEGFSTGLRRAVDEDLLVIALSNEERRNPNAALQGLADLFLAAGE